jgi:thiamine pyrophosphate-dependent acetolactate synthase large subunit-like protein
VRKTGARHLVDVLTEFGVEVVFGVPGVHDLAMPLPEAARVVTTGARRGGR